MSVTQVQTSGITDNAVTTNKVADGAVTSNKLVNNSNGKGNRTVSTSLPSGGSDGDIWYVV